MTLAVLLDTSFLLPSFGVDTGERVERCLRLLAEHKNEIRAYYSRYSILEAVLVLLREVRRSRLRLEEAAEMAETGATTVTYGLEAADTPPEAFREALRLYGLGHKDMFDNILYATAAANEMYLLTVDRELIEFVRKEQLTNVALTPEDLREKLLAP